MDEKTVEQETKQMVVQQPTLQQNELTMWNDAKLYNEALQRANALAKSDILPQAYIGKTANVLIAIDIANRLGLSPMVVMQNSQVVKGNFTWKGSACKAMIDGCGKYKSTRYVETGVKGTDSQGIYLEATDWDGNIIKGVEVNMAMAKAEGWAGKNGSKWETMPELMLRYRASAFFFRTECASIAMGFLTNDEAEDVYVNKIDKQTKASVSDMLDEEINLEDFN